MKKGFGFNEMNLVFRNSIVLIFGKKGKFINNLFIYSWSFDIEELFFILYYNLIEIIVIFV